MAVNKIIENLLKDFAACFVEEMLQNPANKVNCSIFSKNWLKDCMFSINTITFEMSPKTSSKVVLEFMETLCHFEPARNIFEYVNDLGLYLPRPKALERLQRTTETRNAYFPDNVCGKCPKLDPSNMCHHLQTLLELEDVGILRGYLAFVQRDVFLCADHSSGDGDVYYFHLDSQTPDNIETVVVPNIDEVVVVPKNAEFANSHKFPDCSIEMDYVELLVSNETQLETAQVRRISKSKITIQCKSDECGLTPGLVDIIFRPLRQPIRYQYRAIELLSEDVPMLGYLFPKQHQKPAAARKASSTGDGSFRLVNNAISKNPEQFEVVRTLVTGANCCAPYIIFGPPGTGKTTTLVEAILQLRLQQPGSRVLVAAGSNAACDTIAVRLCQHFASSPMLREHRQNTATLPLIRIFSKEILRRDIENVPDELLWRSNITWRNGVHDYPAIAELKKYGIIATTLCTVGMLVCGDIGATIAFSHIFIDEAGASSEPEALVGIMGIKNGVGSASCQVVLSGDHKQLGPVLKSVEAGRNGLGVSLMERLLTRKCYAVDANGHYDRSLQMRLRRNYRSHPEIVRLYNHLYYDDELIAMKQGDAFENAQRQWSVLQNPQFPIAFQVVDGAMTHEDTTSSCNMLEIEFLLAYIRQLLRVDKVEQIDIGVITPYKLQCKRIKVRFLENNWTEIEVGSVESFQGREKLVIIASMVRSDRRLGFVKCLRRLNVLLSRAIALLIILGEPRTLSRCKDIEYIIKECKQKNNFIISNETELAFYQKNSVTLLRAQSKLNEIDESTASVAVWPHLSGKSETKVAVASQAVLKRQTKHLDKTASLEQKSKAPTESHESAALWAAFKWKTTTTSKYTNNSEKTAGKWPLLTQVKSKLDLPLKKCDVLKPQNKFQTVDEVTRKTSQKAKPEYKKKAKNIDSAFKKE